MNDARAQFEPMNLAMMPAICLTNESIMQRVLVAFQQQLMEQTKGIEQSIADSNAREMARLAHSLKGAAGTLCAEPLRQISLRLETLATQGELDQADSLLTELRNEADRCVNYVREYLAKSSICG
jgi:two-component system, sensor histidine kinase and response regulator